MRIEIDGTESPAMLRALMQLLSYLAEPPATVAQLAEKAHAVWKDATPPAVAYPSDIKTALFSEAERTGSVAAEPMPFAPAAQSAVPLPPPIPAPSIVAAPALPTAPVAPVAGIPMPPGAGLPPVPTVPPVPAPPAVPSPAGVATDKSGLPHDPRIHSAAPTITADGNWRKRRGLNDPALVARVEEELRQTMAAPSPQSAIPLPPAVTATAMDGSTATPTSGAASVLAAPIDFVSLIQRVTHEVEVTKMLTMDEAEGAAKAAGLPGLAFLAARPDLVADVSHRIDVILAS